MPKICNNCKHFTLFEKGLGVGTCRGGPPTPWLTSDTNNPQRWRGKWPQVGNGQTCGAWKWQGIIAAWFFERETEIEKEQRINAAVFNPRE